MYNASAAAQQLVRSNNGATVSQEAITAAMNKTSISAKLAATATKALVIAGNMIAMMAIGATISFAIKKFKELNPTIQEVTQSLNEHKNALDEQSKKVVEVGDKLQIVNDRIEALQKLGGIRTLVEDEELAKLERTKKELEAISAIEKERLVLQAQETLDAASKAYKTYSSKYTDTGSVWKGSTADPYGDYPNSSGKVSTTPVEELENTIEAYNSAYEKYQELTQKIASGTGNVTQLSEEQQKISQSMIDIRSHALEMYNAINGVNEAYQKISKYGGQLEESDRSLFDQTSNGISIYNEFLANIKNQVHTFDDASLGADNFADSLEEATEEQEDLNAALKSIPAGNQIASINDMASGFEKLDKIMADVLNKGTFDYSNLADTGFTKIFGGLGKDYTNFIETISKFPNDISKCQSAFDGLVSAWFNSTGILRSVTEETAGLTTAMLENMGVTNASQIVQNALAVSKAEASWSTQDLTNATAEEIQALANEIGITEEARQAFYAYIAQKLLDVALNPNGDIEALASIINALGLATTAWQDYYAAKQQMEQMRSNAKIDASGEVYYSYTTEEDGRTVNHIASQLSYDQKERDAERKNRKVAQELEDMAKAKPSYSGGVNTNKPSGGGSNKGKSAPKENSDIDWIDRRIKLFKDKETELEDALKDTFTAYTGLSKEEIQRAEELFNSDMAIPENMNEILALSKKAGMSISELQQELQNGSGLESRQSILTELIGLDQQLLSEYEASIDQYRTSYEDLVAKVPGYRDKIEHGGVDIELVSGEQKTQIENAIGAYDDLLSAEKNVADTKKQLRDREKEYSENIIDKIDSENTLLEKRQGIIESQINLLKASGHIVTASSYEEIIRLYERQAVNLEKKIAEKKKELAQLDPKEDTEEWHNIQNEILDLDNSLIGLNESIATSKRDLLQLPITNMGVITGMYNDMIEAMQRWGSEIEASGKKLGADYYQSLIQHGANVIDEQKKTAELIMETMDEFEKGSEPWQDLYDQLQSINGEMSSMVENLYKWNEALLQMPLDSINQYSSSLQQVVDSLSDAMNDYDTVISTITGAISDYIDTVNDEKDRLNDDYQDRIDSFQKQLDLINDQNEALKLQTALEKAKYELEQLMRQSTVRTIREGKITYEHDQDAIRNAEEKVADAQLDIVKKNLQDQIDDLNDSLDDINDKYDDQIKQLEKMSEKWSEIKDNVEKAKNEALTSGILGDGWKDKVINANDDDIYNMFKGMYESLDSQKTQYEEQLNSTENIYALLENYIASYKEGTLSYEQAMMGINTLLSQVNDKMSSFDNLQNILDFQSMVNGTTANAEDVLKGIQNSLSESASDLLESFEQYNKNSGMITEYTTSWEQLVNNTDKMTELLKQVRDNLADALERSYDRDDEEIEDDRDDKGSHSKPNTNSGFVNSGPGVNLHYSKGIENGLVGNPDAASREAALKIAGTKELDYGEYLAVVDEDEAVFTPEQQQILLSNLRNAHTIVPSAIPSKSSFVNQSVKHESNISITLGDLNLPDVRDVDGFAKAMATQFKPLMLQELRKIR